MDHQNLFIYNKWLHRFAALTAVVAVGLIIAGATVTSTGSGDAVPDWPLSYGTLAPPMIGGILFEHSHRLIAGLTGILIAILAFWLWQKESRRLVRWMGMIALAAVVVQAVLGGLRVLIVSTESVQDVAMQLTGNASIESTRILITIAHAALAQTVFSLIFAIAVMTSKYWQRGNPADRLQTGKSTIKKFSLAIAALIFVQLILGALVRHTGAGLIIPDFPLSFGKIIPPFGHLPHNPNAPFPLTEFELTFKVALQFAHRMLAFIILGSVIYFYSKYRRVAQYAIFAKLLLAFTVLQVSLGALNIWTGKSVYTTVLHVAVGALLLACTVTLILWNEKNEARVSTSVRPATI